MQRAPINVRATTAGTTGVTVSWDAAAGASTYAVYRGTTSNPAAATLLASGLTATEYDDATAERRTIYYYWIKAVGAETSAFSGMATGWNLGGTGAAPANVAASDTFYDKIRVTWDAVAGADGYEVWRSTSADSGSATFRALVTTGTQYDDTSVDDGVTYYYWLKTVNFSVGASAFSSADAGSLLALAAPTGVAASDGLTSKITISWSPVTGATDYEIWVNTVDNSGTATKIFDSASSPKDWSVGVETVFYLWVRAKNAAQTSDFSASDTGYAYVPPPPVPDPPTSVAASDGDESLVTITWDSMPYATSYEVWRSPTSDSGSATLLADGITGTSYQDEPGDETVRHYFVKSVGASGTSGFSSGDSGYATTPPPPDPPASVTASDGTEGDDILVEWAPSAGATGYEIWRAVTNNPLDASLLEEVGAVEEYRDPQTSTGTFYYWVKAIGPGGTSALSSAYDSGYAAVPTWAAGPTATTTLGDKVRIEWDHAGGARHYWCYRNTVNDFSSAVHVGTDLEFEPEEQPHYDDTDAAFDTNYFYWVVAFNNAGDTGNVPGIYSGVNGYRPLYPPAAPTSLNASTDQYGYVGLSWVGSENATSYSVWRNTINDSGSATEVASGLTGTTFEDEPDVSNYAYYWVKAHNSSGASAFSGGATGLPQAPSEVATVDASDAQTSIDVSWSPSTGADAYSVWRNTSNTTTGATEVASGVTGTSWEDTTATPSTPYYYWVKAHARNIASGFNVYGAEGMALETICGLSLAPGAVGWDVTYAKDVGGNMTFDFNAYAAADRLIVYNNGSAIYDTGCITGTASSGSIYVSAGTVRVYVQLDCASVGSVQWDFDATCA